MTRGLSARGVLVLTLSALSPAASVYVTGSTILHLAGTGTAAALIAGGLVFNVASLLYAELGAAFPRAGGIYPGIGAVLGPGPGFVAMVLGLVTAPAFLAFASLGVADYLRVLAPALPKLPVAVGALALAAGCAALSIRTNAWITGAFLAAEVAALVVLAVVAGTHPARPLGEVLLHPVALVGGALAPTSGLAMAIATIAGTYACAGSALAIYFAEELAGEPRGIGRVVAATGAVTALLVATPLVLLSASIPDLRAILAADAPIAAYLLRVAGPGLATATTIAVALAILNNVIASLLAFSRFLHATARDGTWPAPVNRLLARLHPRFGSPWLAAVVLAGAAAGCCLAGQRRLLVILSGEVFTVALVVLAVIVGRRRGLTGREGFRAPLGPVLPVLGLLLATTFVLADLADPGAGRPGIALLAGVAVIAWGWHHLRTPRAGAAARRPPPPSPPR